MSLRNKIRSFCWWARINTLQWNLNQIITILIGEIMLQSIFFKFSSIPGINGLNISWPRKPSNRPDSIKWHTDHAGWTWWRHQMETFSALLVLWAGNSPVTGEFPSQRPVTRSFDVFFEPRLSKRLSKQSWGWWFETPSRLLWRHYNDLV